MVSWKQTAALAVIAVAMGNVSGVNAQSREKLTGCLVDREGFPVTNTSSNSGRLSFAPEGTIRQVAANTEETLECMGNGQWETPRRGGPAYPPKEKPPKIKPSPDDLEWAEPNPGGLDRDWSLEESGGNTLPISESEGFGGSEPCGTIGHNCP